MIEMLYTKDTLLSDDIHSDYYMLTIVDRYGLKPGFGNITLLEMSAMCNIKLEFLLFLIELHCSHDIVSIVERYKPSTGEIIDYINRTHNQLENVLFPYLQEQVTELTNRVNSEKSVIINDFFNEFIREYKEHIAEENTDLLCFTDRDESTISDFIKCRQCKRHSEFSERLKDIKQLLIVYSDADNCVNTMTHFLMLLNRIERDLSEHSKLEDYLLSILRDSN
jgi:regulator of cell morphogenesis and NO signaling